MNKLMKGAAKRLIFSLLVVSALSGCAVYGPPNPEPYTYGTDAYGQTAYAVPRGYSDPYYPYYPSYPYYPYYYGPASAGPPVFFNFGYHSFSNHRGFRGGHDGYRGGHGPRFGRGRGHR